MGRAADRGVGKAAATKAGREVARVVATRAAATKEGREVVKAVATRAAATKAAREVGRAVDSRAAGNREGKEADRVAGNRAAGSKEEGKEVGSKAADSKEGKMTTTPRRASPGSRMNHMSLSEQSGKGSNQRVHGADTGDCQPMRSRPVGQSRLIT